MLVERPAVNPQAIDEEQLSKLRKLLQLTKSENDNEALSAIRKANSLLDGMKMNWEDLCKLIPMIRRRSMTQQEFAEQFNEMFGAAYGGQATVFPFSKVPEHMRPAGRSFGEIISDILNE